MRQTSARRCIWTNSRRFRRDCRGSATPVIDRHRLTVALHEALNCARVARIVAAGMMNAMDTAVGKISTAVKRNAKLYEHSIIVFSTVSCPALCPLRSIFAANLEFLEWLGSPTDSSGSKIVRAAEKLDRDKASNVGLLFALTGAC